MLKRQQRDFASARPSLRGLAVVICAAVLAATPARADSLTLVSSESGQAATDAVSWAQLGADGTILGAGASATSAAGFPVTASLAGSGSLTSIVCPASPCSWGGAGFGAGDSLIWTADAANGGNGPVTFQFGVPVSGAGALIQADGPAPFTAQIQAFNGATPLGSFTESSDANGDAIYIGVHDQSGANITSVVLSLTSCEGNCTDFAIDTLEVQRPPGPTPVPTSTATSRATATPTATATPRPTPAAAALGVNPAAVRYVAPVVAIGSGTTGGTANIVLRNPRTIRQNAAITISAVIAGGTNGADFTPGQACVRVLPPGSTCTFPVRFSPTAMGLRSGTITIIGNQSNGSRVVTLTGTGMQVSRGN